jgi:hypothetical protein
MARASISRSESSSKLRIATSFEGLGLCFQVRRLSRTFEAPGHRLGASMLEALFPSEPDQRRFVAAHDDRCVRHALLQGNIPSASRPRQPTKVDSNFVLV